jgi:hypothetical protein
MAIEQYTDEDLKKLKDRSDTERLNNMTEEDIEKGANSDPDNPLLTDEELKNFKRPSNEFRKRFQSND